MVGNTISVLVAGPATGSAVSPTSFKPARRRARRTSTAAAWARPRRFVTDSERHLLHPRGRAEPGRDRTRVSRHRGAGRLAARAAAERGGDGFGRRDHAVVEPAGFRRRGSTYIVQAGTASGAANVFNGAVGAGTVVSGAVPPGTYFLRVLAQGAGGTSAPSNEASVAVGPRALRHRHRRSAAAAAAMSSPSRGPLRLAGR